MQRFYPIGTPGQPWAQAERDAWRAARTTQRSYADEVLARLEGLSERFDVRQYGALTVDPTRYPLYAVLPKARVPDAPWALVTGGVHGYETSGVQGALDCIEAVSSAFEGRVNLVVVPCVISWLFCCGVRHQ